VILELLISSKPEDGVCVKSLGFVTSLSSYYDKEHATQLAKNLLAPVFVKVAEVLKLALSNVR